MATLDESTLQVNAKVIADSMSQSLAAHHQAMLGAVQRTTDNAVAHQQSVNQITLSSLGQITNRMNSVDPVEARSIAGMGRQEQSAQAQSDALAAAIAKALAQITSLPPAPAGNPTTGS